MLSQLLDYTPPVKPTYDDRTTAMIIMVIVICVLALLTILFLYLWLSNRRSNKSKNSPEMPVAKPLKEEDKIIQQYKNLNRKNKEIIKQMLNSLNQNSQEKE